MKAKQLLLVILSFIMMMGIAGCESSEEGGNKNYPITISVTDYSIFEMSCQWTNLKNDEVIIVNSKKEMEKYINCDTETFPEINFSNTTLLLACGATTNGVYKVESELLQEAEDRYTLKVTIHLNLAMVAEGWQTSILTPKIPDNATIELDVEVNDNII